MKARRRSVPAGLALLLALCPVAVLAQTPPPAMATMADPAIASRADALVALLAGGGDYAAEFAPTFRAAIPASQFRAVADGLVQALGRPQAVDTVAALSRWQAEVTIAFEHGTATFRMVLDPVDPHAVTGLLLTAQAPRDDSLARIESDLAALPGTAALGIYRLGQGAPRPFAERRADQPMPLGSAFKLWVLAEASRQVAAGTRRWADVLPVGPASLPSGVLQTWPAATPVTLQTLATLMVSISDNTAADTLMHALGRPALDRAAAATGLSTPVLSTREAFVLKGDAALRARWLALPPTARTSLLARDAPRFDVTPLATGVFANGPVATDSVEWFATPNAVARLLDRLRIGDATTRAILAINPGTDPATAARFAYLGYKGGSEPGVLTLNYLVRTKAGTWFALTLAWHRPDGETSEATLAGLATRALILLADR